MDTVTPTITRDEVRTATITSLKLDIKLKRILQDLIKKGEIKDIGESELMQMAFDSLKQLPMFAGHCATHGIPFLTTLLKEVLQRAGHPELAGQVAKSIEQNYEKDLPGSDDH
jgi:hypothetical protein